MESTVDVKMEFTVDEILRTCKDLFDAKLKKSHCIFFKNIKIEGSVEEVWDGIQRLYNDSEAGTIGKLRLTSTALIDIIVELMHSSHEPFTNGVGYALCLSFHEIIKGQEADETDLHFIDVGSQTVEINHPEKCLKQADKCYTPVDAHPEDPSVVIEVGCSETIIQLRGDMPRWFFKASIKMVILLEIGAKVLVAEEESPTLTLELWQNIGDVGSQWPVPEATRLVQVDWTHGIKEPLKIPIWPFVAHCGELPEDIIINKARLERLRKRVIRYWRREEGIE